MNHLSQTQSEMLQDRYALRIAARLNLSVSKVPYEVPERLRAAREQALATRKRSRPEMVGAPLRFSDGSLALDPRGE